MSDDKKDRGPADRSRINVHERYERDYWMAELNVGEERLRAAVAAVGVSAEAVRNHLKK